MTSAFSYISEDVQLMETIRSKGPSLTVSQLLIPEKYYNQAPWELAQRGNALHQLTRIYQ